MTGIERDNAQLKGVLPMESARPALDKTRLGQLIDLISNIRVGDAESRAKDVLGRVYEYFLSRFASGEVLFIDARKMGQIVDRTHRELTAEDITRITSTYHAWRGEKEAGAYEDIPGFCKAATLAEIRKHGHVLTPGRYAGAGAQKEKDEPFRENLRIWALRGRKLRRPDATTPAVLSRHSKNRALTTGCSAIYGRSPTRSKWNGQRHVSWRG